MAKGIKMHETTLKAGMTSPYKCQECNAPMVVKENKSGQAFLACPMYGKGCDGSTMTLTQEMIVPILDLNDVPPPLSQFGGATKTPKSGVITVEWPGTPGGGGVRKPLPPTPKMEGNEELTVVLELGPETRFLLSALIGEMKEFRRMIKDKTTW